MSAPGTGDVVIHVCDESRNVKRDFFCDRALLVAEMGYFKSYLNTATSDDIDISVHCDVNIFEWLMRYMKNPENLPSIGHRNVVSILISSDFLQMTKLVSICLNYIRGHFSEVVKIPIDLTCISDGLVAQLSGLYSVEDLDRLGDDPKDKLTSRIYLHQLNELWRDSNCWPCRCSDCGVLFSAGSHLRLVCDQGIVSFGVCGERISIHRPSKSFKPKKYLVTLRGAGHSWSQIFWHCWGLTTIAFCGSCSRCFSATYATHCRYHTAGPTIDAARNSVVSDVVFVSPAVPSLAVSVPQYRYGCCSARMTMHSVAESASESCSSGCCVRPHIPVFGDDKHATDRQWALVKYHSYDVCLPGLDFTALSLPRASDQPVKVAVKPAVKPVPLMSVDYPDIVAADASAVMDISGTVGIFASYTFRGEALRQAVKHFRVSCEKLELCLPRNIFLFSTIPAIAYNGTWFSKCSALSTAAHAYTPHPYGALSIPQTQRKRNALFASDSKLKSDRSRWPGRDRAIVASCIEGNHYQNQKQRKMTRLQACAVTAAKPNIIRGKTSAAKKSVMPMNRVVSTSSKEAVQWRRPRTVSDDFYDQEEPEAEAPESMRSATAESQSDDVVSDDDGDELERYVGANLSDGDDYIDEDGDDGSSDESGTNDYSQPEIALTKTRGLKTRINEAVSSASRAIRPTSATAHLVRPSSANSRVGRSLMGSGSGSASWRVQSNAASVLNQDNDINADGDVLSSDHDSDLEHGSEAQVNAHMTAKQQVLRLDVLRMHDQVRMQRLLLLLSARRIDTIAWRREQIQPVKQSISQENMKIGRKPTVVNRPLR